MQVDLSDNQRDSQKCDKAKENILICDEIYSEINDYGRTPASVSGLDSSIEQYHTATPIHEFDRTDSIEFFPYKKKITLKKSTQ